MWAVGVGVGVTEAEGGEVRERRVREGGLARAMAQKGQDGLGLLGLDEGDIGVWRVGALHLGVNTCTSLRLNRQDHYLADAISKIR